MNRGIPNIPEYSSWAPKLLNTIDSSYHFLVHDPYITLYPNIGTPEKGGSLPAKRRPPPAAVQT